MMVPGLNERAGGTEVRAKAQRRRTVKEVARHSVSTERGTYSLEGVLGQEKHGLLERRVEFYRECALEGLEDDWESGAWEDSDPGDAVFDEGPCWWLQEPECDGDLDCGCGPVTLLEALGNVAVADRAGVLAAHMGLLEELWSHFWSGQALTEGGTATIGDACVECLVEGHAHVYSVFSDATQMAEELGEALAAFECSVTLHAMRWDKSQ
jgi:hypothetical protein